MGVLHDDVRLPNMLVREPLFMSDDSSSGLSKLSSRCVVMIDLASITLREDYTTDEMFRRDKEEWVCDMGAGIGFLLNRIVPPEVWKYKREDWEEAPKHIL